MGRGSNRGHHVRDAWNFGSLKEAIMDLDLNGAVVKLDKCARLHVRNGVGRRVLCLAGGLWITQENDRRDILLKAGECFVLDRRGLAIIGARSPAKLLLLGSGDDTAGEGAKLLAAGSKPAGVGRAIAFTPRT